MMVSLFNVIVMANRLVFPAFRILEDEDDRQITRTTRRRYIHTYWKYI